MPSITAGFPAFKWEVGGGFPRAILSSAFRQTIDCGFDDWEIGR
jgi:hypothetical protein